MTLDNLLKLLLAGASLCLGSYLTALRAKLMSNKRKNNLHIVFYIVTVTLIMISCLTVFNYGHELLFEEENFKPNYFAICIILLCFASAVLLFLFTKKNLIGNFQYKTSQLDPVVNKFTSNADKNNIKLLAGDINFFGNSPSEMESNAQYNALRKEGFREIQILCWKPITNDSKIRYGKIQNDLTNVEFRYYNPPKADLKIRGRLKTLNNVTHLLMYNKIASGLYEALEIDTANSNGALYSHLWELVWETAEKPSEEELEGFRNLYRR